MSFINKNDFVIGCDYCLTETIDTGEADSTSASELCKLNDWFPCKSKVDGRWIHLCPKCKDDEDEQ